MSTAIEGNPLTPEHAQAFKEEGRELAASDQRSQREVLNYFARLRYIEQNANKKTIRHNDVFAFHQLLADGVIDQGQTGRYRTVVLRIGNFLPPPPSDDSRLMFELLKQ